MNTPTKLLPTYLLLATVVLVWALAWPISKIGLDYMAPIWYTVYRLAIAAAACFALLAIQGNLTLPKRADLPIIFSIGILQMSLFLMLVNYGLNFVDAGRSAILVYSTPLWVTPLAILFFGEKTTLLKLVGVLFGLFGIFLLFSPWEFSWNNSSVVLGNLMLLMAAMMWAITMLHTRFGKWHSSAALLVPWQLLLALILTLPAAIILEPQTHIIWNAPLIYTLLYNGLLATAFGYWAALMVSRNLPVVTTSLYFLAVPVIGLLLSSYILHESLTLTAMMAMSSIVFGLACVALSGDRFRAPAKEAPALNN
ncbi:MAG: DMT family transporter [Pseudomonadota bacterium]|nr:DMT family transporter [Pseudomonadota bacterium]